MPEGDTLRILATRIDDVLAGGRVERSVVRDPRLVGIDLEGRTLVGADAYGKHLFVRFDDDRTLHAHLLMTGSFAVGRPSREPEWKRRVELWLDRGRLTGEQVPVLGVLATRDEHTVTDGLGPDLCAITGPPDPTDVAAGLTVDPDTPLTGALLDQRRVAGFGNVYANDLPFVFGVSPFRPVGRVERLATLGAVGVALIRVNARLRRQNTTGRRLDTDARWLHGRGRRPCPVCGARLEYLDERSTPWRRSITWCRACQPDTSGVADLGRAERLLALHPARRDPSWPLPSDPARD